MKIMIKKRTIFMLLRIMLIVSSLLTIMLFYKKTIEAHEFRPEAKIFSHASIEENFSDNAVIVVLYA